MPSFDMNTRPETFVPLMHWIISNVSTHVSVPKEDMLTFTVSQEYTNNMSIVANLLMSPTVKKNRKSVNIYKSYEQISSGTFLWPTVYKKVKWWIKWLLMSQEPRCVKEVVQVSVVTVEERNLIIPEVSAVLQHTEWQGQHLKNFKRFRKVINQLLVTSPVWFGLLGDI